MDKFRNHVDKYYDICPSTCKVDNCPIGYTRTYPDKSCHRVAEINSAELVPNFEEAQAKCRAEGARLYQPRNQERAQHFL